jgi:hypothetical protein
MKKGKFLAVLVTAVGLVFALDVSGQSGDRALSEEVAVSSTNFREKDPKRFAAKIVTDESVDEETSTQTKTDWYVRPDSKTRFRRYANNVVGPVSLGRYALVAGIQTARNEPEEWGGQLEGFGRRFASEVGRSAISNTIRFGLDEAFKYDSKFYLSRDKKNSARFRNALLSTVAARDKNGKRVLAFPKLAGNVTSNIVANTTWFPERFGVKDGLRSSAISVGIEACINLFREFVLKK